MTGETDHKLRGDYSRARADYTVDQEWDTYSAADHDLWRRLYARQLSLVSRYASEEFCDTMASLNLNEAFPSCLSDLRPTVRGRRGGPRGFSCSSRDPPFRNCAVS